MHTPGPWQYCYDNDVGPNDDYFIEFYSVTGSNDNTVGQADNEEDARLMAAAPELLDALRRSVLALAWASEQEPAFLSTYEAVNEAINKATGESL